MRTLSRLTLIVLIVFLTGCASLQAGSPPSVASQPPTSTEVASTPSLTALPTHTPAPTLAIPTLRTPQVLDALPASGLVEFHIIHWNDFHGELRERYNSEGAWIPGAARLAGYIDSSVETYGRQNTLLLDAGDWFENTDIKGESKAAKGLDVLAFYQRLGVDAITVGNHDLFLGVGYFDKIAGLAAPIEILSGNFRKSGPNHTCTDVPIVNAYQIYELGAPGGPKVRVAVIGIGAENLQLDAFKPILGVCFQDPVAEVEKIYDELMQNEKPDVLVLLSHSGMDVDRQTAEALNAAGRPVDLIIGGHSHTWIDAPEMVGNTTIVQAGDYGRAIGDLDLVYDRAGSTLRAKWQLTTFTTSSPQDLRTLDFLNELGYVSAVPTLAPENPNYQYLIDLKPVSESVGFWTLGKGVFPATDSGMLQGQLIYSHGKPYPNGLFAHSPSKLRYALDGGFQSFAAEISIKDTACGDGASFSVVLDQKEIYNSGEMLPSAEPKQVNLDVRNGKVLELQTISGSDTNCDWTIWGDPYLIPNP